jgi:TolB protein
MLRFGLVALISLLMCASAEAQDRADALEVFEGQSDVGNVLHPGSAKYDPGSKTYTLSGSGENMWAATDEFHFAWKKISAENVSLTADITILSSEGNNHRKGVLMIRQSLDTDSAYVDAARHGEGLTSLQFRDQKGATTREIESSVSGPEKLRIEKQGDRFYMWIAGENQDLQFAGGSAKVQIHAPFYVGIGVTAHDKDAITKVAFKNVDLQTRVNHPKANYSTVETVLPSGDARTAYVSRQHLTSPGWSSDGHAVTFDVDGRRQQEPFTPLRTAAPVGSPVSDPSENKYVYFASKQGGGMQIWRKMTDGSQPEQLTSDDFNDTSPHLSPDGKLLVFLSYSKNLKGLPKDKNVSLRTMSPADKKVKTLATFVGGQGSLGTEPWSPDGKRLVFISYQSMR